ncbi:MAG: DUF177 domain-containing protein [Actinobacteria bacterium]|nr:DUF177 domain-containing protein [Actinomycetota bacterium]
MTSRPPLLLNVADVRRHLGARQEVQRTVQLPALSVLAARVLDGDDIDLRAAIESTASGAVAIDGVVHAPWVGECRRCLREVTGVLEARLQEVFEPSPTEGETYPLVDEMIELEPMVRDAVLLALPLAPLCDDGCRGPDPSAFPVEQGRNRAPASPGDANPPIDPRWAALGQLAETDT